MQFATLDTRILVHREHDLRKRIDPYQYYKSQLFGSMSIE
jgi:hypothetical protein